VLSQSEILPADTAPLARRHGDSAAPKRDRRQYLTKIDNRSRLGIRIRELKALFESAFPAGELTPLRREKIGDAAQLKALAEEQRGAWLRGEATCSLDDLVRIERRADQVVRALGINEASRTRKPSPIVEHFSRPPVRSAAP
jgi:hypothetical protein